MNSIGPSFLGLTTGQGGRVQNSGGSTRFLGGGGSKPGGGSQKPKASFSSGGISNINLPPPGGPKLMRLRCRFRPMHEAFMKNGVINEDDSDVIFLCGDGHQVKAHKVVLATASKFFATLFCDQGPETSVVTVPDIKVDIMKLILRLAYRETVILTMEQIKGVGDVVVMFGMAWALFSFVDYAGDEPFSALPQAPIPMKRVELPRKVIYVARSSLQQQSQPLKQERIRTSSPLRQYGQGQAQQVIRQDDQQNGSNADINFQENSEALHSQAQNERHSRKSKLTPRTTIGDEIVEQDQDEDEDPENKMRDWMARLGKRTSPTSSTAQSAPLAKKIRISDDGNGQQNSQEHAPESDPALTCSTCNARFKTEIAWRWHEERHVGHNMFKCQFCDELFSVPKFCYIHEKEEHGYSGMKTQQQPSGRVEIVQVKRPPVVTVNRPHFPARPAIPSGYSAVSMKIKLAAQKKMQAQNMKKPSNFNLGNRHPGIAIVESEGSELMEPKKMKQLHWLYVCQKCENCTDSSMKAEAHYNICYPEGDVEFANTVVKHKQGFYGKSKCPLCPRRYPQNSGFMIHCGHQHTQYRRLFSHTGNPDDQLKCQTCLQIFSEPQAFHDHLTAAERGAYHCNADIKEEEGNPSIPIVQKKVISAPPPPPAPAPAKNPVGRPKDKPSRPRRVESPIESKASYKVQFHTPPKSARLASRVQAEEAAEAAKQRQSLDQKASTSSIDFPCTDCPVCGEGDVPNISQHLQTKHKDLKIDVTRVSTEWWRCKNCTITFSICDLLDHKNCFEDKKKAATEATKSEGEDSVDAATGSATASRRASGVGRPPNKPMVVDINDLPPGVGRSPIEKIEMEDLHSIQAIRSALKCKVCGLTAKKLGAIAECLRAHGIQRCSLCFNSYCSKADYTLHLKKCHGASGNKLKCPLCPKAFSNAGQTSGHMYSTHWLQILKENEIAQNEEGDAGQKGKGKRSSSSTTVATRGSEKEKKKDKDDGVVNGSNESSEQSFEGEAVDGSKSGEELDDSFDIDDATDERDPLAEEMELEDETVEVEGSNDHDLDTDENP